MSLSANAGVTRAVAPDLFESRGDGIALVAGRRGHDRRIVFPFPSGGEGWERVLLGPHGRLWSWTVQRFRPKSPPYWDEPESAFRPFVVGYVELPEIIVESRIEAAPESLRIGMTMVLGTVPLHAEADGTIVTTYAFRPEPERR